MPQQCCLLLLCIHSIQESTLKELINFRGQFGGKYWVKTCEYFTSLFTMQRRSHKLKSGGAQIQERCKTCNIKKLRCKTCNIKPLSKLNERTSNSAFKVD